MSDNKLNLAGNVLTGTNSKAIYNSTLRKSSRIRSQEQIQVEIDELNNFYNKRHNIVKKLLIREKKKLDILTWSVVSLAFYFGAMIGAIMLSTNNLNLFFNFTGENLALDFIYMPIYLFVHLFTVSALTFAIKRSVLALPKVMDIPIEQYKKSIKRFESNLGPIIIALPFILYDSLDVLKDISSNSFQYIGLVPELVLFASWVLEWIIFANIIWLMAYYVIFIYRITKKYHYDSELLSVVLKNELKPIVHVGYEQSIILTIFLVLNITYTVLTQFYTTDFIASIVLFLLIPTIAVLPIQFVHNDLTSEIKAFVSKSYDRILPETKRVFIEQDVPIENKIDFVFTDRILYRLQQIHKSHSNKTVYLRIIATMTVPAIGYYIDYRTRVMEYLSNVFHINIYLPPISHIILTILSFH